MLAQAADAPRRRERLGGRPEHKTLLFKVKNNASRAAVFAQIVG